MLKLVFVAPKFRLRRVEKNGKKSKSFLSPVKVRNFGNFLICVCTKLDSCFHSNSDKNQNIFSLFKMVTDNLLAS